MAEEVSGVCGWSAVRRIDLDGDSNPGFKVLGIEGALCRHREHKMEYEFKRIDSRGQAGEYKQ